MTSPLESLAGCGKARELRCANDGPHARRKFEVSSAGVDENLQLVDSTPYRSLSWLGLRVPAHNTPDFDSRYLFNGCAIMLNYGQELILRGMRQFWSLGVKRIFEGQPSQFDELDVTSPNFRMPDSNVSWHLTFINLGEIPKKRFGPLDAANFAFQWAMGPALLYIAATFNAANLNGAGKPDFYTTLTGYTPPRKGRPWGRSLVGNLQTRNDTYTTWRDDRAWHAFGHDGIHVRGPGIVSVQISVRQGASPTLAAPPGTGGLIYQGGLQPERDFILNYPGAVQIWRVGAALIAEDV